jgi:hypothetical protein
MISKFPEQIRQELYESIQSRRRSLLELHLAGEKIREAQALSRPFPQGEKELPVRT